MRRQLTITCTLTAIVLMLLAGPAVAAPLYNLKADPSGIPYILHSTAGLYSFGQGGFGGLSAMTVDGNPYVALGQQYSSLVLHAGDAYQSLNNSATPTETVSSYLRHWDASTPSKSTVCNGRYDRDLSTEVLFANSSLLQYGMTRPFAEGRFFGGAYSGGSVEVADIQLEALGGTPDATSNAAGLRSQTDVIVDAGQYKNGLALVGQAGSADTWNLLVGSITANSPTATLLYLGKVEMGALTGLTDDVKGTRSYTQGGYLTDSGGSGTDLFANLVPDVADSVVDFAINPTDGRLYFLSIDETNDKAYLSAVSLTGGWGDLADDVVCTYVDLDTETADKYLDITYDNGTDPALASYARGLGFSEDGKVLFVARNAGDGAPARVFIMEIPEPATMGLLGLGFAGMAALRRRRRNAS